LTSGFADDKSSLYEKRSYQPSQLGYLRKDLGDEDEGAALERTSDHTFYSVFNKKGLMSDNTSVIDISSRSTSLVGQMAPPLKKVLPPKLNLALLNRKDSEDIDEIDI
jgi:hypothetical protein